jgi:hypothetical protein
LNTIKTYFHGYENRSLGLQQQNLKKPLLGGYPWEPEFKNSEYASWPKWGREPKAFSFLRVFHVLWLFISKKHVLSKNIFSNFLEWNKSFIRHYLKYFFLKILLLKTLTIYSMSWQFWRSFCKFYFFWWNVAEKFKVHHSLKRFFFALDRSIFRFGIEWLFT